MSQFTPKIGFYVMRYPHFRPLKNRPVVLEIVSITKTEMLNLKDWKFIDGKYWRAVDKKRKKLNIYSVKYPLDRDYYHPYDTVFFDFEKAKYYKTIEEFEEDQFGVEGESILI